MSGTVHVVGAGLAGLAAAVRLADSGERVVLHEAAKAAGGRCRSYRDAALGLDIDNGNHLLLSGNEAARAFLDRVGGMDAMLVADEAAFDFADIPTKERWRLRPNAGRLPWWILAPSRRVPGTRLADYLAPIAILRAPPMATIGSVMACEGTLWTRLWHPVLVAALNTEPADATAGLAARILRETLGAGGNACRPMIATGGLSSAFVTPALDALEARGAEIRLGTRLRALTTAEGRVTTALFADGEVSLGEADRMVLSVPAWVAAELVPDLVVPTEHRAIVNAHYAIPPAPDQPPLIGLVGGVSEWLFAYPDRVSVTISAADRLLDTPREELAATIWREIAPFCGGGEAMPTWQLVREKRATFAATPAMERLRPGAKTPLANLALAGDWTDTGLPATIEGAIRSGNAAAELLQRSSGAHTAGVAEA